MAVTYEYVGKTGGGNKINRIDVPGYSTGDSSKDLVTVPVPTGESAKVAVSFRTTGTGGSGVANYPMMSIGSSNILVGADKVVSGGGVFDVSGPVTIRHNRMNLSSAYHFPVTDFVIYWWLVK